jgi:hypothetical protein
MMQVVLAFLPTALYLIIRNLMSVKSSSEVRRDVPWESLGSPQAPMDFALGHVASSLKIKSVSMSEKLGWNMLEPNYGLSASSPSLE